MKFENVAGIDEAKEELMEIVDFLKAKKRPNAMKWAPSEFPNKSMVVPWKMMEKMEKYSKNERKLLEIQPFSTKNHELWEEGYPP